MQFITKKEVSYWKIQYLWILDQDDPGLISVVLDQMKDLQ